MRLSIKRDIPAAFLALGLVIAIPFKTFLSFGVAEVVLLVCAAPAFILGLAGRKGAVPLFWWSLALVGSVGVSSALGYHANPLAARYGLILTYNVVLACMMVVVPIEVLRRAAAMFVVVAAAVGAISLIGLLLFFLGHDHLAFTVFARGRSHGLVGNPNYYALGMLFAFLCSIWLARSSFLFRALAAVIFLAIFASMSRGVLLGVAAMVGIAVLAYPRARKWFVLGAAGVAGSVFALLALDPDNLLIQRFGGASGFLTRAAAGADALSIMELQNALFGYGRALYMTTEAGISPHNSYITLFMDTGVIGLGLFVSVLAIVGVKVLNARKDDPLPLVLYAGAVAVLVSNDFHLNREWWLSLALSYALAFYTAPRDPVRSRAPVAQVEQRA